MTIDLDKIPKTRRLQLIELGRQFGSRDTLDQANQTLAAYETHAAALKSSGFGDKQAKELAEARNGLLDAGVGREAAKGKKKVTGEAYVLAFQLATGARLYARTVLTAVKEDLEARDDGASAAQVVSAALRQTRVAPKQAEPLVQQLALLGDALADETIAAEAAEQGGPEAAADVTTAISALRKADQEDVGGRGTPMETEKLDLLDGIIVQQVRRARRAAAMAAKRAGNPALVKEFKLDLLYRSSGAGAPAGAEDVEADDESDAG